jgi:hypothetical protein
MCFILPIRNFIHLETLTGANDRVSNAIAALPIFRHYDINSVLHSSSDGQRFETRTPTINARYSPKYFLTKKGQIDRQGAALLTQVSPVAGSISTSMDVTSSGSRQRLSTSIQSSRSCLSSPSHKLWMTNLWNVPYWGYAKNPTL